MKGKYLVSEMQIQAEFGISESMSFLHARCVSFPDQPAAKKEWLVSAEAEAGRSSSRSNAVTASQSIFPIPFFRIFICILSQTRRFFLIIRCLPMEACQKHNMLYH